MLDRLIAVETRYDELADQMAQPEVAADYSRWQELQRERASLEEVVTLYRQLKDTDRSLAETESLLKEELEPAMESLAREEREELSRRREGLFEHIKSALLPQDPNDERSVIVEIRAGAGGEEAALFAAELFRMYERYAEARGWRTDILSASPTGIGGFKEIVFEVEGRGAYSRLKYESGVHRVQRVPQTEASGRIHTSTATVAVLPEAEEVEVEVNPDELRIDIFHSGGAGGQNVNKVATAVRLTHLPTGLVVTCQDERSQLKNRTKALAVLRARLLARERAQQEQEVAGQRRSQVGSGERSEKVRTYNFPQDRVTDHRVGLTRHSLAAFLDGDLDDFIDAVATDERTRLLQERLG